jgi:hypothetical protein
MKDEINKFGDIYKSQTRKMRFRPYSMEKEVVKYSLVPEQVISERLLRARTRDTDQQADNAIANDNEREDLYNDLYTKWVDEKNLSNTEFQSAILYVMLLSRRYLTSLVRGRI